MYKNYSFESSQGDIDLDRYYTIMIIPEREKSVKTFRIPRIIVRAVTTIFVFGIFITGILAYDYWNVIGQVYQNKHLSAENRQLREQVQQFQMKLNSFSSDLQRINTLEKKLRIIAGVENVDLSDESPYSKSIEQGTEKETPNKKEKKQGSKESGRSTSSISPEPIEFKKNFDNFTTDPKYLQLKNLYDQKMAGILGIQSSYAYTKKWSDLFKRSFALSQQFASFDFKYSLMNSFLTDLEIRMNDLDQYLLDRESFLKSTPTILPTNGWITSYYGPRKSPISGRRKFHEGLDVGARLGTTIIAAADGIVTFSGHRMGLGNYIQLDHGYGLETIYAHAKKLIVKNGELVQRGDSIAQVGNTGYSTAPHLHYEVRVNGVAVDPLYYVLD